MYCWNFSVWRFFEPLSTSSVQRSLTLPYPKKRGLSTEWASDLGRIPCPVHSVEVDMPLDQIGPRQERPSLAS